MSRQQLTAPDGSKWERVTYDDEPAPVMHARKDQSCGADIGTVDATSRQAVRDAALRWHGRLCPICKRRVYRVSIPMSRTSRVEED